MHKSSWLIVAATSTLLSLPTIAQSNLQTTIEQALKEEGLVGAVWMTLSPEGGTVTGAAGLKDASRGERLATTHRVQVGSNTKPLIATGVLRLVTQGRIALDTRVADVLPEVNFDNPWAASHPLLIRHLLDHSAGLDDIRLWQAFSLKATADTPLRDALGERGRAIKLRAAPGSRFSYSNTGYTLLGMVIETVTGERYESFLDANVLKPLSMSDSTFGFVTQIGDRGDSSLAMGHFENGRTQAAVPMFTRPAGQFITTAADMARFAKFLMSSGMIGQDAFIHAHLLRRMGAPEGTEAADAGLEAGYSMGMSRRYRHGSISLCHSGNTVGYRAMLCLFPEEQKAFFMSINTDSETARYARFDALLTKALNTAPATPATPAPAPANVTDWQGVFIAVPNRFDMFAYLDMVINFTLARWDGERLHLKTLQASPKTLQPLGGTLFSVQNQTTASHVLLKAADGAPVITDGFVSLEKVALWRIAPLWVSLLLGVMGLVYVLLAGLVLALRLTLPPSRPLFAPLLAVLALLVPLPLFLSQSFLQLGDLTVASATLAIVTGALPFAAGFGLWQRARRGFAGWCAKLEAVALFGVLQWMIVLAAWGLVPLRLWA